jgi:L-malate glycosyltransferase
MLSILHLDTGRELRGGQWQILTLARGLRNCGHRQVIAAPEGSALQERAGRCGFETFPLPASAARKWRWVLLLRRLIRQSRLQIVHAHDGRGQTLSWLASLRLPVRRVATRRVAFRSNRWIHRAKYGFTCDAIIAVSEFVRKRLVDCGVPAERIVIIPDGIEIPTTLPSGNERKILRAECQFEDQDFVIGHLGAFTAEKGQDVAAEAVALLAGTLPRIVLLLAGDGPARRALEQQYAARSAAKVRFLGWVEDLCRFFACLDLFIMPSHNEGLGSSALMAMAYGLPVIASRTGGLTEIVDPERTGWLVEPGAPAELAQAIRHAISIREQLSVMGQVGREKARRFSSDILTAKTEALYYRLLEPDFSASAGG